MDMRDVVEMQRLEVVAAEETLANVIRTAGALHDALRDLSGGKAPGLAESAYATAMRGVCGTRTAVSAACARPMPLCACVYHICIFLGGGGGACAGGERICNGNAWGMRHEL